MKKSKLREILTCLAIVPLLGCATVKNDRVIEKNGSNIIMSSVISNSHTTVYDSKTSLSDSIKNVLVDEVDSYIHSHFSNTPKEIPELFVNYGLDYNIDICFIMAQSHIETGFGSAGIGRRSSRKSLFGIYATYSTYDKCMAHYIETLQKHYLTKGRDEHDLMKKYVTTGGSRYARYKGYEHKLSYVYKNICKSTSIKDLQEEYYKNINTMNDTVNDPIERFFKPIQVYHYPWHSGFVFCLYNNTAMQ